MKYWTKEGHIYTLKKNNAQIVKLVIIGVIVAGLAIYMKDNKPTFRIASVFSVLCLLGSIAKNKETTIIDTKKKQLTIVRTIFSRKFHYDFNQFTGFEVEKVTYAFLRVSTAVYGYFLNENGNKKKAQIRVSALNYANKWTQELIEEMEIMMKEMKPNE